MKHIRVFVLILCACFVSVAWSRQAAGNASTRWSEFHRSNMMRWDPYENVLNVKTVRNLHRKWSFATANLVFSSLAVANGVVYVGSLDNNVYALNAKSGAKLWSYATGNQIYSSPAVANGVVYVGSADNKVYALNAKTGAKLWSYTTGRAVESSPAVANGVVYVGSDYVYAFGLK